MNPSNNIRSSGQMQSISNQNASIHGTTKKSDINVFGGTVNDTINTSELPTLSQALKPKNSNISNNMSSKVISINNSNVQNQSQVNDLSLLKTVVDGTKILTESNMRNNNMASQNININNDPQNIVASKQINQSNFPQGSNNPFLGFDQNAHSTHVSKDPSKIQNSNINQFSQANIMSVDVSTMKSNNNINASKKPVENSFPMPPMSVSNQKNSQFPNNQSIKPGIVTSKIPNNNNNYNPAMKNQSTLNHPPNTQMSHISNVNAFQSAMINQHHHPNMNLNSQQVSTMKSNFPQGSFPNPYPNQNINPQQQSIQQSHQMRQSAAQSQMNNSIKNQNMSVQNQVNNSKMNNSSMKKSNLRTSRNKSPPMVIEQNGKKVSIPADNNGNSYYTTSEVHKSIKASLQKIKDTQDEVKDVKNSELGTGFRFYGQITKAGRNQNGEKKTNQDVPLVKINIGDIKGFNIFGVLDGHGPHGHFVSKFCKNFFIRKMNSLAMECKNNQITKPEDIYARLKKSNLDFFKNAFHEADIEMTKQREFEYNFSGTTCNIVVQLNKHLICASVGDSRGILIYDNDNKTNQGILPLSNDHRPDLPQEFERILKNGGMVDKLTDQEGNKVGPNRVFKYGLTYPGLAMSRSLGDFQAKECGVTTEPQIVEHKLNHNSKYMAICSDGVWEFLTNENVRDIGNTFYQKGDIEGFCSNLVKKAVQTWEENDIIRDDITVVCVYFN